MSLKKFKMNLVMKKIITIGLALIMGVCLFCGCGRYKIWEMKSNNIIELKSWNFTSGTLNNMIIIKYQNDNVVFECEADAGSLSAKNYPERVKRVEVKSGETIFWSEYDFETNVSVETAYVDIVLKEKGNIIGYVVIKIGKADNGSFDYTANILNSVLFPRIRGLYQNISEEYINSRLINIKTNKGEK